MRKQAGGASALMLACALLAGCGGGGSGGGSASPAAVAPAADTSAAEAAAAAKQAKEADADRLAKQATFGPTKDVVDRIVSLGVPAWLDEQFATTGSSYADLAVPVMLNSCGTDPACQRRNFTREQVAMRFYANALAKPDQLRQRVAFALSQLLVTSALGVGNTAGLAAYQQILLEGAFGNYRDLLMKVTLSGYMGDYLDMADSNRSAPSENYARELLQLFTIGPDQLNMDGSSVRDASGATIANYTPDDVKGVARALTGWTYARQNGGAINDYNAIDYTQPMIQVAGRYDSAAKSFLGTSVPAGAAQADSVGTVLNAAFNNASTAPFVAKFLIRHLVTANPTPAYVTRVASVFVNNGNNVRGDLKAVIRAILTDAEARGSNPSGDAVGKVKEPVLLMTSVARAVGMTSDGFMFTGRDNPMGQWLFAAPSVFNYYATDYPLPGSTRLVSPVSKLMTTGSSVLRANMVYDWTIGAVTNRNEFAVNTAIANTSGTSLDWTMWEAFGTDTAGMVDRIDYLFLNRSMTSAQKAALKTAAEAIADPTPATQARKRAAAMLYIVLSSPLFQVDR